MTLAKYSECNDVWKQKIVILAKRMYRGECIKLYNSGGGGNVAQHCARSIGQNIHLVDVL